ncbi:hypothetical protein Mmar10_0788 [Maricaulis maris MCS10]|uniref:Uncharacterized protein n=2 Tax=Maricaulaceae TaxID=2800061 RepID=Q0ARK6_MARMM|nr:hypothetical protein Mmar10_0788 [Maricaulis maris MCS10]
MVSIPPPRTLWHRQKRRNCLTGPQPGNRGPLITVRLAACIAKVARMKNHTLDLSGTSAHRAAIGLMSIGVLYCLGWLGIEVAVRTLPQTHSALGPQIVDFILSVEPIQQLAYLFGVVGFLASYGWLLRKSRKALPAYYAGATGFTLDWVMSRAQGDTLLDAAGYVVIFYLGVLFLALVLALPRPVRAGGDDTGPPRT